MTRRVVEVYFSGVAKDTKLHRAGHAVQSPGDFRSACGVELDAAFSGWFPADLIEELDEAGDRLCRAQGCFHRSAMARMRDGRLGKLVDVEGIE